MPNEENEPNDQMEALGAAIRAQRKLANLSLRQLAGIAEISNPYLSEIERGLHAPSVHVLRSIANALSLSAETLQEQAGAVGEDIWTGGGDRATDGSPGATELAVRRDVSLTDEQKAALLAVYRSYRDPTSAGRRRQGACPAHAAAPPRPAGDAEPAGSDTAAPGRAAGRRASPRSAGPPRSRARGSKKTAS